MSLNDTSYLLIEGDDVGREGVGDALKLVVTWEVAEWKEVRLVNVRRSGNDDTDSGQRTTYITYTVQSDDTSYGALDIGPTTVTVKDDDTAGLTVSPVAGFTLTEGGGSSEVKVNLNTRPQIDGLESRVVRVRLTHDVQVTVGWCRFTPG